MLLLCQCRKSWRDVRHRQYQPTKTRQHTACQHDISKTNKPNWHKRSLGQWDEMIDLWSQEVKGQHHTTPKFDFEAWRRYHSWPLRSSRFLVYYFIICEHHKLCRLPEGFYDHSQNQCKPLFFVPKFHTNSHTHLRAVPETAVTSHVCAMISESKQQYFQSLFK